MCLIHVQNVSLLYQIYLA